jgi:cystathionine beta-synthase
VEGIGGDKIPDTLHFDCVDAFVTVPDPDAFRMARRLAREEGIFVGGSSGLNVCVALDVAREIDDPDACIVVLLPDTGERYLSKLFDDDWMRENQMLDAERVTAATLLEFKEEAAPPLVTVAPSATVRQALNLMGTYNVSQLPVVDNGENVGSVAEGSLMARSISEASILARTVREVMEEPFPTVDADMPLENVASLLSRETPAALVRTNGEFVGIVTRYDILHKVAGIR